MGNWLTTIVDRFPPARLAQQAPPLAHPVRLPGAVQRLIVDKAIAFRAAADAGIPNGHA